MEKEEKKDFLITEIVDTFIIATSQLTAFHCCRRTLIDEEKLLLLNLTWHRTQS